MICIKCRVNPDTQTKLRLFADSAGYCQRPECRKRLFSDEGGEDYHIAEMAHVFAAVDGGPRTKTDLSEKERAAYENLILLCPNCHTEIDKAPDTFPDEIIAKWKLSHKETIKNTLGVAKFCSRAEVRAYIEPLLTRNKMIFEKYGPDNAYRENPEAEEARVWQRKMVAQVIPNDQTILLTIDSNVEFADEQERKDIELFRQHVDDLIERHLGENRTTASQFPAGLEKIFSSGK